MSFIDANQRIYQGLKRHFPHSLNTVADRYPSIVGQLATKGRTIADIGGGAQCAFAEECRGSEIIAVDISASELEKNRDVSKHLVGDVTKRIPLEDNCVDVVASRFVVEHLRGTERFVEEAFRVLKPGGVFVTLFPNKHAPFSLINRALSPSASHRVAYALKGEARKYGIFPAYYEYCSPKTFQRLCAEKGFAPINVEVSYAQSGYFAFLFPLAFLSFCYEAAISFLKLENLSAHVLVSATKPVLEVKTQLRNSVMHA